MSDEYQLTAEARSDKGKGASRRLRRLHDRVPAIVYGGKEEAQSISLELRELKKALENEAFFSTVLTLNLEGKQQQVVMRDLQRDPKNGFPKHADLLRVDRKQKITMVIPLHFLNEESCIGVKQQGGEVQRNVSEVEVTCLPQDLPEYIEVDLADSELDTVYHLSDLTLPEGVEILELAFGEDHDQPVVSIHEPKVRGADKDQDEDAGEEGGENQDAGEE